ncbi:hypothetical protein NL676_001366 [Syzygium grande]|nr:hypothetical protein NL676_001366 [Syzygium grande]
MLHKLLKVHKLGRPEHPKPKHDFRAPAGEAAAAAAASSSALKIVHAGGAVECYFMPIPAARIVERYPSFYVTRPEVFRHPWESVVGPDETLALGEKYYLVPRHTVKKLRRRTRRPSRDDRSSADFGASRPFNGGRATAGGKGGDPSGSFAGRGGTSDGSDARIDYKVSKTKTSTAKKHVSVRWIDEKPRKGPPAAAAAAAGDRKHGEVVGNAREGLKKKTGQSGGEMSKVKPTPTWQPALASISEAYGPDE